MRCIRRRAVTAGEDAGCEREMSCGGEKGIEEMAAMRDEERGTPKNKRSIEKEKEEKEG